ncbi:MAG TPA: hypothetical protein VNG33_02055 [Polyangiaceae bacterium]|nr:hypothetical protein [Polyangiaceae bacterium]
MLAPVNNELPEMLMTLRDGGTAEYYNPSFDLSVSFSASCVTSALPSLKCGGSGWTAFRDCRQNCDLCTCATYSGSPDADATQWGRTDSVLTLSLFGQPAPFAYCLSGDQLQLSGPGAYLVFERVQTASNPLACEARTPDQCLATEDRKCEVSGQNTGCRLGQCTGSLTCEGLNESGCGTNAACVWHPDACWGVAPRVCLLKEYGRVPGCELTTKPVTCQGTPLACEGRNVRDCTQGCTYSFKGQCVGVAACEGISTCPSLAGCKYDLDGKCSGEFSCATLEFKDSCEQQSPCVWNAEFCAGAPSSCASLSADECATVPGCFLAP